MTVANMGVAIWIGAHAAVLTWSAYVFWTEWYPPHRCWHGTPGCTPEAYCSACVDEMEEYEGNGI